jgi:hypothetical protein
MSLGDPGQDILEIGFRIEAVEPCRDDQRIDGCRPLAAAVGPGEQIVLPTERHHGAILPISTKRSQFIIAGTRYMAARSDCSTSNGDLAERGRLRIRTKITHKLNYPGFCLRGVFERR